MNNEFFETSKKIANEFLQSVVFIDDMAFIEGTPNDLHAFSTRDITRAFANSQKVCAVYKPETVLDIENLAILAKKVDVTVLDWQINVQDQSAIENAEEDVEEEDPRGIHTRRIIQEILRDPLTGKGSLKLILIYTGEIDLAGIADSVYRELHAQGVEGVTREDCRVGTPNVKIVIIAKPSLIDQEGENKFKYNPDLKDKIVLYEDLPDFILTEFTRMTAGLLSNFVLRSLSVIRSNTFRLIKLYRKELDPAFLAHRLLLPDPDDSKEHLIEMLSHSIQALLNYNEAAETTSIGNLEQWVDLEENSFTSKISFGQKEICVNRDFVIDWIKRGFFEACRRQWEAEGHDDSDKGLGENALKKKHKEVSIKITEYLMNGDTKSIDSEFSILTHHKSNLKQQATPPRLSLGTLIRQAATNDEIGDSDEEERRYFLCIQARCDSVRVESVRKFLFLELEKTELKFDFIVEDGGEFVQLAIKKHAFELRTIKFLPTANHVVEANFYDKRYYFESNHNERFIWLADLKDAHAQRVVNKFAAKISRVGLDEYEWLRMHGGSE